MKMKQIKTVELPFETDHKYKVYHDGSHYCATLVCKGLAHKNERKDDEIRDTFNEFYRDLKGLPKRDFIKTIRVKMENAFPRLDKIELSAQIDLNIKRVLHNVYARKKRFRRKVHLNKWNYFVTFTYSDDIMSEKDFSRRLKKCLSNLATRRKWRVVGCFERGGDTNRLHFHCLIYVPQNQMIGEISDREDFDTRKGHMQVTHCNSFFEKAFGRNDFETINEAELAHGNLIEYMLKYIEKSGSRFFCTRGVNECVTLRLKDRSIATTFFQWVTKYVLFDDEIDWARDVAKLYLEKPTQLSMFDIV